MLYEAAAVLAGTVLMAAGISGSGPGTHDSSATLASLMPGIARCREGFYSGLLQRLPDPHGDRLRQEAQATRQPFGGARQHLNHFLSRHRAAQMQQRHLAVIFAEMGYPDAGREEAARIPAASVRMLSEVLGRLASAHLHADRGELADAARLLPEAEDLLHRGIACGAFADPWNILGFQGLFPLSPAREESVRDPRIEELVCLVEQILGGYVRLLGEAAGTGDQTLAGTLTRGMERLAEWWDQFASVEVGDVPRVHGGEAVASAKHVATALARWHQRGEAPADLAFWRQHLEGFRSPKAFASVVEALLRKQDFRAALGLLMSWLSQAEQVPLEDGEHAFHPLALHWMLAVTSGGGADSWPLVQRFFDQLEANADDWWQVPTLGPELLHMPRAADEDDNPFAAAYEDVTFRDSADDEQEGSVADGGSVSAAFPLEAQGEEIGRRLRFLSTLARLWALAARHDPRGHADAGKPATLATWLATAREKQRQLLDLLDTLHACAVPEPSGSQESLMEYDRRRGLKEHLTYAAVGTCLDVALATGALHAAAGLAAPPEEDADRPAWEPWAMRLEQAFLHGDAAAAREALPHFLEAFCNEPLLFVPLAEGGAPRQVLRARFAQMVLRAMAAALPRLGLLRETHHLLATAWAMERAHPVGARGVTEFNHLFQGAFQAAVENVVASAEEWPAEQGGDEPLVTLLETVTRPFLGLWVEHSRGMQLSSVEGLRSEEDWQKLREFVRWYGRDLFHAGFMPLANLRGILHRGVGNYLDYLADNADPLHPVRLVTDLEGGLPREPVLRWLQFILQAVVENYEEFRDYNTTVARSDYGENLYLLLDFLRLKAGYERHAWQVRPLVLAHEVLAYLGRERAARLWEAALARSTRELAEQHLEALARLEQGHGMRLGTVADRLGERFVRPLALDRLCALIEPAVEEAREAEPRPAFERLRQELRTYTATPTGVGLDVPPWLRQVGAEVQRVRAERTTLAELAEDVFQMPERLLTFEEVRRQFADEETPDERGASGP